MSTKTMESLSSKKFDSKSLGKVSGGETTYGNVYPTHYDGRGGQEGDNARTTYNPPNRPAGTEGTDYVTGPRTQ